MPTDNLHDTNRFSGLIQISFRTSFWIVFLFRSYIQDKSSSPAQVFLYSAVCCIFHKCFEFKEMICNVRCDQLLSIHRGPRQYSEEYFDVWFKR